MKLEFYEGRKVLITGHKGFIGSHLWSFIQESNCYGEWQNERWDLYGLDFPNDIGFFRPKEKYEFLTIAHNPEFLTARNAVVDFANAQRTVIGGNQYASRDAANFYYRFFHETPVITMSSDESEAVKYFSNTFLAYKVAYFNKIFDMYEKVGMDYKNVVEGVTADSRIGTSHTRVPGIDGDRGFGGTCFPKDINSLIVQLEKEDINADMFREIWKYNQEIRTVIDWTVT